MSWSKTKKKLESLLCNSLENRIKYYSTTYRANIGTHQRIWITLDKTEIFNISSSDYTKHEIKLFDDIMQKTDLPFPKCFYEYYPEYYVEGENDEYSRRILEKKNILDPFYIMRELKDHSNHSIDDLNHSKIIIYQALLLFDKRFGKRRLELFSISNETHPLIIQFYRIRCEAEGIIPNSLILKIS